MEKITYEEAKKIVLRKMKENPINAYYTYDEEIKIDVYPYLEKGNINLKLVYQNPEQCIISPIEYGSFNYFGIEIASRILEMLLEKYGYHYEILKEFVFDRLNENQVYNALSIQKSTAIHLYGGGGCYIFPRFTDCRYADRGEYGQVDENPLEDENYNVDGFIERMKTEGYKKYRIKRVAEINEGNRYLARSFTFFCDGCLPAFCRVTELNYFFNLRWDRGNQHNDWIDLAEVNY